MIQESEAKTFVVVGATGDVGRAVTSHLAANAGNVVRPLARGAGVSIDDAEALRGVFAGAHGAFLMIPFDYEAADLHRREEDLGARLAEAVQRSVVPRVVLLSGLNAALKVGTSIGAARMEERLDALGISELVHLRAGFFMENLTKGLAFVDQVESGSFGTPFRGDRPMPMIAAVDVGRLAATMLTETSFRRPRVVELRGEEHTMEEATAILGGAFGKAGVSYVRLSEGTARARMNESGMSGTFVEAVLDTARSFNRGDRWGDEHGPQREAVTSLAEWAAQQAVGATWRT